MFDTIAIPFGWLMLVLYEFFKDYGIAVIVFALLMKVILLPFQMKSKRSMMQTTRIQPKLKELEKKHGANKQKYNEEVGKLYKEEKINPMSGCIWTLIPFPILIALYQAISQPLTIMMGVPKDLIAPNGAITNMLTQLGFTASGGGAYGQIAQAQFISKPEFFSSFAALSDKLHQISYQFLGIDLGLVPDFQFLWKTNWSDASVWLPGLGLFLIPIISTALTYASTIISTKMNSAGPQQNQMKSMMYLMPLISLYIAFIMPAALGLYWIATTFFGMVQDIWLTKRYRKIMDAEDAVKLEAIRAKEAELEAKRIETERLKAENKTYVNPNTAKRKQQKTEHQEMVEKASQWEKKNKQSKEAEEDAAAVGTRRYARGRAYDPERFDAAAAEVEEHKDDAKTEVQAVSLLEEEYVDTSPNVEGIDKELSESDDGNQTKDPEEED